MKDGVIADFEHCGRNASRTDQKSASILASIAPNCYQRSIGNYGSRKTRRPRFSGTRGRAKEVHLIAEPMAAAIGIGVDVEAPVGNIIIDIGGGTTEIAVIALSGIVNQESIRVAGDELTMAVMQFFKRNFQYPYWGTNRAELIEVRKSAARCH